MAFYIVVIIQNHTPREHATPRKEPYISILFCHIFKSLKWKNSLSRRGVTIILIITRIFVSKNEN